MINAGPITEDMLRSKPFANVVRDIKELVTLYPDTPKDVAFEGFYEHSNIIGTIYYTLLFR